MKILHIGPGAFSRAHLAEYTHDANKLSQLHPNGTPPWTISTGSLRSDPAELARQNGKYVLETVKPSGVRDYKRIESIDEVILQSPGGHKLIDAAAQPNVGIISCTVTPAGYHYGANKKVDITKPEVEADIKNIQAGATDNFKSVYGVLFAMLAKRAALAKSGSVSVCSLDNVRQNGTSLRDSMLLFLHACGQKKLGQWTEHNVGFPNSMVDRITPKATDELKARVKANTGFADQAPVMAEYAKQWVIEDKAGNFPAGRPQWEKAGAEVVADVEPFEEAKVRLLNATHAGMAWRGAVAGKTYVHEVLQDSAFRQAAFNYGNRDVIPSLEQSLHGENPVDLSGYLKNVVSRFKSPYIQDTNQRVSRNGSAKILDFILPTIRERLASGKSIDSTTDLIAGHYAMLKKSHEGKLGFTVDDPAFDKRAIGKIFTKTVGNPHFAAIRKYDSVKNYVDNPKIFGELAGNPHIEKAMRASVKRLEQSMSDQTLPLEFQAQPVFVPNYPNPARYNTPSFPPHPIYQKRLNAF